MWLLNASYQWGCTALAFFDWKAIKGQNASKPYAIAMEDGGPLGVGGFWEN